MKVYMIPRNHYMILNSNGDLYIIDAGFDGNIYNWALPFIKRYMPEVKRIKGIFITHYHSNHTGGVPTLLKHFGNKIEGVYSSGKLNTIGGSDTYYNDQSTAEEITALTTRCGIPYEFKKAGDTLTFDDMKIEFLSPLPQYQSLVTADDPDGATTLSMRFTSSNGSAIFFGDMGKTFIKEVLATLTDKHADVMAVPHHGDKGRIDATVINIINPKFCIVELHGTSPEVKTFLQGLGYSSHILLDGPVEVALNKGNVTVNTNFPKSLSIGRLPM